MKKIKEEIIKIEAKIKTKVIKKKMIKNSQGLLYNYVIKFKFLAKMKIIEKISIRKILEIIKLIAMTMNKNHIGYHLMLFFFLNFFLYLKWPRK